MKEHLNGCRGITSGWISIARCEHVAAGRILVLVPVSSGTGVSRRDGQPPCMGCIADDSVRHLLPSAAICSSDPDVLGSVVLDAHTWPVKCLYTCHGGMGSPSGLHWRHLNPCMELSRTVCLALCLLGRALHDPSPDFVYPITRMPGLLPHQAQICNSRYCNLNSNTMNIKFFETMSSHEYCTQMAPTCNKQMNFFILCMDIQWIFVLDCCKLQHQIQQGIIGVQITELQLK